MFYIGVRQTSYRKTKEASPILWFHVLSINNFRLGDFVDRIYLIELEINNTTDTDSTALYLDLHLEIDSEGHLRTKLYDKRGDFPIVIFPFICSNIPAAPAYGVYISLSWVIVLSFMCIFSHSLSHRPVFYVHFQSVSESSSCFEEFHDDLLAFII